MRRNGREREIGVIVVIAGLCGVAGGNVPWWWVVLGGGGWCWVVMVVVTCEMQIPYFLRGNQ